MEIAQGMSKNICNYCIQERKGEETTGKPEHTKESHIERFLAKTDSMSNLAAV